MFLGVEKRDDLGVKNGGGPGVKSNDPLSKKVIKALKNTKKGHFPNEMPLKSVLEGGQNGPKIPEKKCFFCRLAN